MSINNFKSKTSTLLTCGVPQGSPFGPLKLINYDLRNLSNWFNASKIMLNVTKTELVIFKPKCKKLDF